MQLRAPTSIWQPFIKDLCARADKETAGIAFAQPMSDSGVFVLRHAALVPDDAYLIRERDRLRLDPVAINQLVRPARDNGWCVFTVHSHPQTDAPWFSVADDLGDERLMPSLHHQMDGPHGSMVAAGNTHLVAGRVWTLEKGPIDLEICVVGRMIERHYRPEQPSQPEPWYHRQRLALGEDGNRMLRATHVGVVGLGGTGSAAAVQLAHLGIGQLTFVDGDIVEHSNVSRIVGCGTADAGETPKVEVASRYVQNLGLGTQVTALHGHLGREVAPDRLAHCDVVLSCVDAHTPRALLNRLAYDALIPVIDMGSAFRIGQDSALSSGAGRVVVIGPGRPCLACWGHIDADRLREEALDPEDRDQLAADGYIQGAHVEQPSVIAFNTAVAAAAVIEVLRLITAFDGSNSPPARLAFDFIDGTVRRNQLVIATSCRICGSLLGRGEGEPDT